MLRSPIAAVVVIIAVALIAVGIINFSPGLTLTGSGQAQETLPTALFQYPETDPTPTIAPVPTTATSTDPSLAASTTLYQTNFDNDQALADWEFVDLEMVLADDQTNWIIQDGHLAQDGTGRIKDADTREILALVGDQTWTDYTITAKAYDQFNATFGVVARYQDADNFYRYRLIANRFEDTPKLVLEKVVDGQPTTLFERDAGYDQNRWYTLALSVDGDTIMATLDGDTVAQVTDSTFADGQAGLYTRALGNLLFDDVTVTAR